MKVVTLLGAPGSGKGTQAELLSKSLKFAHISTGAILRNNPKLDPKFKKLMNEGKLLTDEMMLSIVKDRLSEKDCQKGCILDGYPRTTAQAKDLETILKTPPKVFLLVIRDEDIKDRLINRRTCENCGAIYNLINTPPEEEGVCDQCGGSLYQREDDRREVIENRLKTYHEKTAPLIDFYKNQGNLIEISSPPHKSAEEIHAEILKRMKG